jgi:hypothetical protein
LGELFHKGRFYSFPETWNDLTGKQLVKVISVLYSNLDISVGRIKLLQIILGWNGWKIISICGLHRFKKLKPDYTPKILGRYLDNTERLAAAAEQVTEFVFEENKLTKQLLPKYKGLFGPSSELANLRMGEFCYTEHFYLQWKETKKMVFLNQLVATLYRPGKEEKDLGDQRVKFDPNATTAIVGRIDRWPLAVKLSIAEFYNGCRTEKIENNQEVFESQGEDDVVSLHGLWSVMRSVAKAGHFGTFDGVAEEYVDTIFMELKESIVEHKKMEEKLEALKHQHHD